MFFTEISPNVFGKFRFVDITRLHAEVTKQIKQAAGRKRQACITVRVGHSCNRKWKNSSLKKMLIDRNQKRLCSFVYISNSRRVRPNQGQILG